MHDWSDFGHTVVVGAGDMVVPSSKEQPGTVSGLQILQRME